ncbi:uncharacterized protein VTP21DRAFT_3467 [Calcarisporiella thermophila]|uniref:uncharacterized protein n=1 Tax=Calcarisporiella thermophila TaxID=911321 RepID=UPI0037443148
MKPVIFATLALIGLASLTQANPISVPVKELQTTEKKTAVSTNSIKNVLEKRWDCRRHRCHHRHCNHPCHHYYDDDHHGDLQDNVEASVDDWLDNSFDGYKRDLQAVEATGVTPKENVLEKRWDCRRHRCHHRHCNHPCHHYYYDDHHGDLQDNVEASVDDWLDNSFDGYKRDLQAVEDTGVTPKENVLEKRWDCKRHRCHHRHCNHPCHHYYDDDHHGDLQDNVEASVDDWLDNSFDGYKRDLSSLFGKKKKKKSLLKKKKNNIFNERTAEDDDEDMEDEDMEVKKKQKKGKKKNEMKAMNEEDEEDEDLQEEEYFDGEEEEEDDE